MKFSAKETKWTSLEVKTHPTFLENLISKYYFGPVKLLGLSRNGPLVRSVVRSEVRSVIWSVIRSVIWSVIWSVIQSGFCRRRL